MTETNRLTKSPLKAAYAVNREMIQFYWQLGQMIIEKQVKTTWGSKFLDQLSKDLQAEFPGTAGFSGRNLKFMRQFAQLYPEIGKQAVSQLPWGHIIVLMQQVKDPKPRNTTSIPSIFLLPVRLNLTPFWALNVKVILAQCLTIFYKVIPI